MSPDASRNTEFVTHEGLFQFWVMPFGLCNAPVTFERLMVRHAMVFMDDVSSFGTDAPEALLPSEIEAHVYAD